MGGAASSRNQLGNVSLVAGGGVGGQESKETDENVIDTKLSSPIKRNNTALTTTGYSVANLPQAGGGPTQQASLHSSPVIGSVNGQISPHQTPSSGGVRSVPSTSTPLRHRSPLTAASGTSIASSSHGNEDVIAEGLAAFYGEDRGAQELEAEMFSHTAMSLGMEQEDLLFNLLYFGGDGVIPDINMAMSNARDETIALHSENNTPYKLRPASTSAIEQLKCGPLRSLQDLIEPDCAVCKDDMEIGVDVIFLPTCRHCFHYECLVRWVKLQGFCPVCRAPICEQPTSSVSQNENKSQGKISPRNVISSIGSSSASSSHGGGGMTTGMLSHYENTAAAVHDDDDDDDDHKRFVANLDGTLPREEGASNGSSPCASGDPLGSHGYYVPSYTNSCASVLLGRRQEQLRPTNINNNTISAGDCKTNDDRDRYDDDDTTTPMTRTGLDSNHDDELILSARSAAVSLTQALLTNGSIKALQRSISASDRAGGGAGTLGGNNNVVSVSADGKNDRRMIISQSQSYSSNRHTAANNKHMMNKNEEDHHNNRSHSYPLIGYCVIPLLILFYIITYHHNSDSKVNNDSKDDKDQQDDDDDKDEVGQIREDMMDAKASNHTGGEVKLGDAKGSDDDSDDGRNGKDKSNDTMAAMLLSDSKHSDNDDDDSDENYIPSGAKGTTQSKHHLP